MAISVTLPFLPSSLCHGGDGRAGELVHVFTPGVDLLEVPPDPVTVEKDPDGASYRDIATTPLASAKSRVW